MARIDLVAGAADPGLCLWVAPAGALKRAFPKHSRPAMTATILFLAAALSLGIIDAAEVRFAGVAISAGATVRVEVPLSAAEKLYASDSTKDVPDHAVAVLAVPRNFEPAKIWPVLVVFSTSDFKRLNRDDLVDFYRDAALKEGWVIIAGDGKDFPRHDTNGWRAAMTLAALDALRANFPGSARWPIAVAGFSGGAKRGSLLAPLLSLNGWRLRGIYLSGVNEDVLSISYRKSHLSRAFLDTPVFISSGANDTIAPPQSARSVAASIKAAGFRSVRFEMFSQGHAVKNAHTIEALRWFRSMM